ncbi:DUF1569 domain-containing protein [Pedobacter sp. ISL-68]|uniref:DUF1569 domain-containing protein n=1 Tax=unclassified Pedobacter TaxID=2628915 RepID=UPI001BEA0AF4|nr:MULTISPECIES: DUF1569 domain-containing protein [unclassified Pedobacter]MBT2560192.1 DUF1569 domain-containing protein [Pedobacter sp. ISL-64]MBT2589171.1 DUF1569 domain-containing protein [Pedobacter sp. ISL-68]
MNKLILTLAIVLFTVIGASAQARKEKTTEINNKDNPSIEAKNVKAKLDRKVINRHLLHSVFPILFATIKQPFVKGIRGKDFFTDEKLQTYITRINGLTSQSGRVWGTMTPAQMLHHLNLATGTALDYFDLPDESFWMSRTTFKFILVDVLSKQPKGLRIPLTFKIPPEEHFDFEKEKKLLIEIISRASKSKNTAAWGPHPLFGKMTDKEWGRLLTMHIDYHLKQFGQ